MKRTILVLAGLLIILFTYRSIFCYRLVALSNSGNLKYKHSRIVYFPTPPLSIINPFKESTLLHKIRDYCDSKKFETYHSLNNYQTFMHIDYFKHKQLALNNQLKIKALKDEQNTLLILVVSKENKNLRLVFVFDKTEDGIIGYF